MTIHPANKIENTKRRVRRADNFPVNTCPASRHVQMIAEFLAARKPYPMLEEEAEHCAGAMLATVEALWKARTALKRLEVAGLIRLKPDRIELAAITGVPKKRRSA